MKYRLLILFGTVMLLGAGCSDASSLSTSSDTSASQEAVVEERADAARVSAPVPLEVPLPEEPVAEAVPLSPLNISMTSGNFFFDPKVITASPGQNVIITFSESEGVHTFVIDELDVKKAIVSGTTVTFVAPSTPGKYSYYCDVGAHRRLGMEGILEVK